MSRLPASAYRPARRRERTVFDGLEPDDNLSPPVVHVTPELIECYEEALAKVDDAISAKVKTRAAWVRLIKQARRKLKSS